MCGFMTNKSINLLTYILPIVQNNNKLNSMLHSMQSTVFSLRHPSATVVSAEPFLHETGTLRCLQKEIATYSETQMMSHIVESFPLTKLNGDLSRLHSAHEDTVSWLTSYG